MSVARIESKKMKIDQIALSLPRATKALSVLMIIAVLASCGSTETYREGNSLLAEGKSDQGLAKLEEAVKQNPKNIEYRIALASHRAIVVNQLLLSGDHARHAGQLTEAEKAYRQAQNFDPDNAMAKQGLGALVIERRHRQLLAEADALLKKGSSSDLSDAEEKLRSVLSENPSQNDALNLKARIVEARVKTEKPAVKLAALYKKSITLEFQDAPLKSVFDVISKVSGLNFFFDKDIRPDLKVTILVKNSALEDAVRLLLTTNQLEQKVLNGNSILIYPSTPQKFRDYQTLSVRTFYLTNADVRAVSNTLKTILKVKDMVIDERLGIILLRDTPEVIRIAERLVALQDLSDPEVMLEVEVMEIKRSRLTELGIRWPSQLTLAPLEVDGLPLTLADLRSLNSSTIQASIGNLVVNANKEDQDGNILANPRIRVRNKERAKVLIGDRVPVITATSTSTGFVSESVSYVDVGLKLEVEPEIYLENEVAIKVNLEVSNLVREVVSKSGTLAYQIGTRGANTVLRLKDGETQILAGLISDEDRTTANKVPGLGDLPLIGRLFASKKDDTQRSEILLSITPHIVRSIQRRDLISAEFESGTETNIGAESLHLDIVASENQEAGDAKTGKALGKTAALQPTPVTAAANATKPTAVIPTVIPGAAAESTQKTLVVPAETSGALSFSWQAPAQVKVGEQFSAVLRVNSQGALRGLPILIGFDPQLLQVVSVQEGDFFKQSDGATNFSHRIDPAQGKVFVATVRQNAAGNDAGINGTGGLVTVTFKALKPSGTSAATTGATRIQLLSATPEPTPTLPIAVPIEQLIQIVP